jgi:HEAT repeat protein
MSDCDISACILSLRDNDKNVRAYNTQKLAEMGQEAVPYLLPLLSDPDWVIRYRASEALGLIQDPETIDPLIDLTTDEKDHVRYMAAKSLGWMEDPRVVPVLIRLLSDSHSYTRKIAASGLSKKRDLRALTPLKKAYESESDTLARENLNDAICRLEKEIT